MAKRSRTAAARAAQLAGLRTRPARSRMLTAAHELATDRGYESIKVGDIATAAGVSRETFYTHFADKRSCLAEATGPRLGEIETELRIAAEEEQPWATSMLESLEATLQERYSSRATPRGRIIEALQRLVGERGYDSVRLADVVKAAKVSYPTFYRHFGGKGECFAAAYESLIARLEKQVAAEVEESGSSDGGPPARLASLAALLAAEPATARLLVLDGGQLLSPAAGSPAPADSGSLVRLVERLLVVTEHDNESYEHRLLAGAVVELIRSSAIDERVEELPERVAELAPMLDRITTRRSGNPAAPPRPRAGRRPGQGRDRGGRRVFPRPPAEAPAIARVPR